MTIASVMKAPEAVDHAALANSTPIDEIDVSDITSGSTDSHWRRSSARLRREAPVQYCTESAFGPYWSVTKYNDIMAVDTNHQVFSSDGARRHHDPGRDASDCELPMFIAMDPPEA